MKYRQLGILNDKTTTLKSRKMELTKLKFINHPHAIGLFTF